MRTCDGCGAIIETDGQWVELRHHREYMRFESCFCGVSCAAGYLTDGLEADGNRTPEE